MSLQVGNGTRVTFEQAHLQPQGLEPCSPESGGSWCKGSWDPPPPSCKGLIRSLAATQEFETGGL